MKYFDLNNLDNIEIVHFELHSFCNLQCGFCPRVSMNIDKRYDLPDEYIEWFIENVIAKSKNLQTIGLNNLNQPILNKNDVLKLNDIICKVKKIKPNVKFKICSNGTTTKNIDCIDILDLNYDICHITRHRKQDFWIDDMIGLLNDRKIKYSAYINPETNNVEMFQFNNKLVVFKPDYVAFDGQPLCDYKQIISDNNFHIVNLDNRYDYLEKDLVSTWKSICPHNQVRLDCNGHLLPCVCKHSSLAPNSSFGHLENINGEVVYIEHDFIDYSTCDICCYNTEGDTIKNFDKYIKVEM